MTEQTKTEIKTYHTLPVEAKAIREEVFVKEQGFVHEFDDTDQIATHLVLFYQGEPESAGFFLQRNRAAGILEDWQCGKFFGTSIWALCWCGKRKKKLAVREV